VSLHGSQAKFLASAAACGLDLSKSHANYGTNNGKSFVRTQNFAKDVYGLEADSYSTAALWIENGQPRLIDLWSINDSEGTEIEYIICLDSDARTTSMQITHWNYPIDEAFVGWVYERRIQFGTNGSVVLSKSDFKDLSLRHTISRPKLEADDEKALTWVPGPSILRDVLTHLNDRRMN
jgi:hypothetical protein